MNITRRWIIVAACSNVWLGCGHAPQQAEGEALGVQTSALNAPAQCDPASPQTCCPAGSTVIRLTQGDDNFFNTTNNRCILALGGRDTLNSAVGNGNTTVLGGPGDDTIAVSAGSSLVFGNAGNDTIFAGNGFVVPGPGIDTVNLYWPGNTAAIFDLCEVATAQPVSSDAT